MRPLRCWAHGHHWMASTPLSPAAPRLGLLIWNTRAPLASPRSSCSRATNRRMFATAPRRHPPPQQSKLAIPGVKHVVAVASGKGGVGKSTTAVNLALACSRRGKRVALVDADIYGPSVPLLMNLTGQQPHVTEDKLLKPLRNFGIECMSMGFLIDEGSPLVWRGPMVMSAVDQLLRKVAWGPTDVMFIDLPPGTGDAQLTLTQNAPLSGAVIVSTPQQMALDDVRRGAGMFNKVDVPLLGMIENMSYFLCPCCGERTDIFGHNGAKLAAEELGMDFLGELPIEAAIRQNCDEGKPTVVSQPDSPAAVAYVRIADRILEKLSEVSPNAGPDIVFE